MVLMVSREFVISSLKGIAKKQKKAAPGHLLSWYQDHVAKYLGYANWSLLHKDVMSAPQSKFTGIVERIRSSPVLMGAIAESDSTPRVVIDEAARLEIREWVKSKFTPLIDFAFYDSESENGYSWPEVDLLQEIQDKFGEDRYSFSFMEAVAIELEQEGPWGQEDNGQD